MTDDEKMNAAEFFKGMTKPEIGNTMIFAAHRSAGDGKLFSQETYETLALQMQRFLIARHYAAGTVLGKPPPKMRVQVTVGWGDTDPEAEWTPWYSVNDSGEALTVVEGDRRTKGAGDDKEGR